MAMPLVSGSRGVWPASYCVIGASWSVQTSTSRFSLQRGKLPNNWWRIACARADGAGEWRRQHRELRVEIQELRNAVADAWVQDEVLLVELENLVSVLAGVYVRSADEVGNLKQASEARGCEVSQMNCTSGQDGDEASEIANSELEGVDYPDKNTVVISELGNEELRAKQEGLSTLRRLKKLNVHDYVHSALQRSYMRSWLQSRGIAE